LASDFYLPFEGKFMNSVRVGVLTWLCISFGVHAEESLTSEKKIIPELSSKKTQEFYKDWSAAERWTLASDIGKFTRFQKDELSLCKQRATANCQARIAGGFDDPDAINPHFPDIGQAALCEQQANLCVQRISSYAENGKHLANKRFENLMRAKPIASKQEMEKTDEAFDVVRHYQSLTDKTKIPEFLKPRSTDENKPEQ
jgi:hypothetical protein